MEGHSEKLPAIVRAGNPPVLAIGATDTITCNRESPADDDVSVLRFVG